MKAKSREILLNAQIQLTLCKTALEINHIIWQYKVCVITQLKLANIGITQLEIEAANRLTTPTSASTSAL